MFERHVVVAQYKHYEEIESAMITLRLSGVDLGRLSLVVKDYQENTTADDGPLAFPASPVSDDRRLSTSGRFRTLGIGLQEMPLGWASFWMPRVGPVLIGGPIVPLIIGTRVASACFGGLSPLGGGLYRLGIPRQSIPLYEAAVREGHYLLIAAGSRDEIAGVRDVVIATGLAGFSLHQPAAAALRGPGIPRRVSPQRDLGT